jgi:RNA polymerase nonessential primary-like sigma factor
MPPVADRGDLQDEVDDIRTSTRPRFVSKGRRCNHWATRNPDDYVNYPRLPPLGYLEESRLIRRARQGDLAARNAVWLHCARLTLSVVNQFRIPETWLADAIQEGQLGFARAIERFDIERLNSFSTYAWYWIYQQIQRFVESRLYPIRLPAHLFPLYMRYRRELRLCVEPGDEARLRDRWSRDEPLQYSFLYRFRIRISTEPIHEVRPREHPAVLDAEPDDSPDHNALCLELLQTLKPRDRYVLERRYGLNQQARASLREIAETLGLTRERVRQIQWVAEKRLRKRFQKIRYRFAERLGLPDAPPEDE